MLKKLFIIIISLFFIFSIFLENTFAITQKKQNFFIITAYYSPLPNQSHYIMGNYEKEIIMNGKGIRGASGKKVFSGMLAAPSKYSFGTKIKLEGLGIAEVADRGGAIVQAGKRKFKYDRIDIWCGYGEKGLQRAMYWGNRIIKGKIISNKSKVTLNIKNLPAPKWTKYYAKKNQNYKTNILKKGTIKRKVYLSGKNISNKNIFSGAIKNSSGVKELQNILKEMKIYSGKINGEYLSIRKIILDFQIKNNIISKKTDIGAGNFGPKTRKTLKIKYRKFLENKKEIEKKEKLEKERKILLQKQKKIALEKARKKIKQLLNIRFGEISPNVRELQIILKKLGFFKYKDTAIFGPKTKKSLINYQISKNLIQNKNSKGAGIFGPNTKKALIQDLSEIKIEY